MVCFDEAYQSAYSATSYFAGYMAKADYLTESAQWKFWYGEDVERLFFSSCRANPLFKAH